jgi:amino acid transporter
MSPEGQTSERAPLLTAVATEPPAQAPGRLSRGALNTFDLLFMVMAAAAPMAVVVGTMPLAFALGNGIGVPGTFAIVIVVMLLFAVGYVRIIPHVRNAGAFYAYISASFGRAFGLGAAYVAAVSYFALSCSTIATLAYFCSDLFQRMSGLNTRWEAWAALSILLVSALAHRRITLAATLLAIALIAEIALLGLLDFAIVRTHGAQFLGLRSFKPSAIFVPGIGIAAIYAFNGIIGIEGTAIYQEETIDSKRTIPKATYLAVIAIGAFYVVTGRCLVVGLDNDAQISAIAGRDPGHFVLDQFSRYLGTWSANSLSVLVVSSAFAASLALFNNSARYVFALARDGVLPKQLARTHSRYESPYVASAVLTLLLIAVLGPCAIAGLDPLTNISTALVGLGSVGLMALLAITSLGIPVYFGRRGIWGFGYTLAPGLGGALIVIATLLAVKNYSALTGVSSPAINRLPIWLVVIAALGICQAVWLFKHKPDVFDQIGSNRVE